MYLRNALFYPVLFIYLSSNLRHMYSSGFGPNDIAYENSNLQIPNFISALWIQ